MVERGAHESRPLYDMNEINTLRKDKWSSFGVIVVGK